MTRFTKFTIWLAAGVNLAFLGFVVQMGGILQLPLTLLALLYPVVGLIALVAAATSWSKRKWKALLPLAVLVAGILALAPSLWLGDVIDNTIFRYNLPKYQQIVDRVQSGKFVVSDRMQRLDLPLSQCPRCYAVFASKETDGETTVEFWVGGGFPVKHSGYMFYSRDTVAKESEIRRRWPWRTKIRDHWYRIGD